MPLPSTPYPVHRNPASVAMNRCTISRSFAFEVHNKEQSRGRSSDEASRLQLHEQITHNVLFGVVVDHGIAEVRIRVQASTVELYYNCTTSKKDTRTTNLR